MCKITAATIKADGTILDQALNNVATVEEASDPALAAELAKDANALLAITQNWQTGSAEADFNDAAVAVEDTLNLFPQTSGLVPFVALAVTAIDGLIAAVSDSAPTMTVPAPLPVSGGSPDAQPEPAPEEDRGITLAGVKRARATLAAHAYEHPNRFRGKVQITRHHFESPRTALRNQWNAEQEKQPTLGIVKL